MNTSKHNEFFAPESVKETIHIIGCGATGSTLAFLLAKLGLTKIVLWDEDIVEEKNVANQVYRNTDVGRPKNEALRDLMIEINPELKNTIKLKPFYKDEVLEGYVFLMMDSIDVRRKVVESNKYNMSIVAMFDFRIRLTDAQHYAADWSSTKMIDQLYGSMNFTEAEAAEQTPRSACGETLSIYYTITGIVSEGISNFVSFCNNRKSLQKMILYNTRTHTLDSFIRDDI